MRERRKLNDDRIAGGDLAARCHDPHHAGLPDQPAALGPLENRRHQAGLETIELSTRIAQTGEFDDRTRTDPKAGADRQAQQVDAASCDVLADLASSHAKSSQPKLLEKLGVNQVDLSQVALSWIAGNPRTVLHRLSSMHVALDTMTRDQAKPRLSRLAKGMPRARAQGDHDAGHTVRIAWRPLDLQGRLRSPAPSRPRW
jgi:hypothetical protein